MERLDLRQIRDVRVSTKGPDQQDIGVDRSIGLKLFQSLNIRIRGVHSRLSSARILDDLAGLLFRKRCLPWAGPANTSPRSRRVARLPARFLDSPVPGPVADPVPEFRWRRAIDPASRARRPLSGMSAGLRMARFARMRRGDASGRQQAAGPRFQGNRDGRARRSHCAHRWGDGRREGVSSPGQRRTRIVARLGRAVQSGLVRLLACERHHSLWQRVPPDAWLRSCSTARRTRHTCRPVRQNDGNGRAQPGSLRPVEDC